MSSTLRFPTPRPGPVRVVFALVASAVGAATISARTDPEVAYPLVLVTVAAFWGWALLEQFPRSMLYLLGVATPLALNIVESQTEVSIFLLIVTVAAVASMEPHRVIAAVVPAAALTTLVALSLTQAIGDLALANWVFGIAFAWLFGELAFRYHGTIDELEHTRAMVADQAAVLERRRIARDVHDLVGHSLSVVMLHVAGARHLLHKDPAEAARALEQAEAAGRASLQDIRRTVAMLRDDEPVGGPSPPSPDLSDVHELVGDYRAGGMDIAMQVTGDVALVDSAIGLAGYRIVQEALTNAARHARASATRVTLDVQHLHCDIAVHSTGGSHERRAGRSHDVKDPSGASGFGLVSMRERARSVGGLLVAGPTIDGWLVQATLPLADDGATP